VNTWIVMCEVSGGVTGHRVGPLRGGDGGQVLHFTEAEARERARQLNEDAAARPARTATFRYWPAPAEAD